MLDQVAHYNDLSPKLRKQLEDKIASLGKKVKYKFNISHRNPDPEKYNGATVWPQLYTLGPVTFRINDPYEDRPGKTKSKQIAMVSGQDDKGIPNAFHQLKINGRDKGIKELNLELHDDQMYAMYIEMHPKLIGGMFEDKAMNKVVSRLDEVKEASDDRQRRNDKAKAHHVATNMKENDVRTLAAAMTWNDNDEMEILRNKVEELAEKDPKMFNDLVGSKNVEIQATLKRAMDKQIISYNPVEWVFIWSSNQQKFASLGQNVTAKTEVERLAEWIQSGGQKADEVYKKIESLSKV